MSAALTVVTGASSGIGLAVARRFAAAGHPLLLVSRHMQSLPGFESHPVEYAAVDVAEFDPLAAAVSAAEARFGPVDCLVANAGTADGRAFDQVAPADYEREIRTNLVGTLNAIRAVLPGMSARKRGTVVAVSSVSDRKTCPVAVGYTASKFGVRAAAESLREAEGKNGVRVVNVAPGYVRTNIHAGMGVTFDEYRALLGDPDFMTAEELTDVIFYCYSLPQHLCVRDIVIAPTRTTF